MIMNRQVWVYRTPIDGLTVSFTNLHRVPAGARIVHCAEQRGEVAIWMEVDPIAEKVERRFQLIGTGQDVREGLEHVGTLLLADGELVLHVYEVLS